MSRAKLLSRKTSAILLVLVIFALSACLKIPESGVAVKAVVADLVFGVPPLPEPVAPAAFSEFETEEIASPSPKSTQRAKPDAPKNPVPPAGFGACPTASDQTFPEEEASTSVKGLPKEGLYRWRAIFATVDSNGKTTSSSEPIDLLRGISRAQQLTPTYSRFAVGEFRFRGVSPESISDQSTFDFGTTVQEFEIVQDGGGQDGIFLTRVSAYEGFDDKTPATFTPEPPIKILPLPVRAGLTLGDGNAGVDGPSLAVLRQSGTVTRRNRVDVCGDVIDSWFVDGEQEYVSPGGSSYTINYDYSVATQFGGYIAFDDSVENRGNFSLKITQNAGALRPFTSFVPENFRPR